MAMASVSLPPYLPAYVLGSGSSNANLVTRDSLVSLDGGGDDEYTPLLKRACLHINQSGDSGARFGGASTSVAARQFTVQYSSTLYTRLHKAKAKFESAIPKKWPGVPVKETLAVSADATAAQLAAVDAMHQAEEAAGTQSATQGDRKDDEVTEVETEQVVVIALVAKEMRLRPNAVDDAVGGGAGATKLLGAGKKFVHDEDGLFLDDDTGRLRVAEGDVLPASKLTNGVVVAVLCRARATAPDVVDVEDVMFLGDATPAAPPRPMMADDTKDAPTYVMLVSGLSLGQTNPAHIGLLLDFVAGSVGDAAAASRIARVIIAGNSVATSKDDETSANPDSDVANLAALDAFLARLAALLPVDLMVGAEDPAPYALPQAPVHACLLPAASAVPGLNRRGNPISLEVASDDDTSTPITILGHAGQCVDDAWRYLAEDDRLEVLASTLRWRHLAPTAPDTLVCHPNDGSDDVLGMEAAPHVLFAGNQPTFATREEAGTRLVCVPAFASTSSAVLVDMHTLEAHEVRFQS